MPKKKQLTIKGAYKRKAAAQPERDDYCDQLETEIEQLRAQLSQKQMELFELEKENLNVNRGPRPLKLKMSKDPKTLQLDAKKAELELACQRQKRVLGLDVAEYEDSHFIIKYSTQLDSHVPQEYGLRIEIDDDTPAITKYSLPLGFNLNAVIGEYDNIKQTEALCAVWSALVAFHTRRKYYTALTKSVPYDVRTFSVLDTSHVELRLRVLRLDRPDRVLELAVDLDYDVMEVFPDKVAVSADMTEDEDTALRKQCVVFTKMALDAAFRECFLERRGLWQCYTADYEEIEEDTYEPPSKVGPREKRRHRPAPRPRGSDDDSWLPDDIRPR